MKNTEMARVESVVNKRERCRLNDVERNVVMRVYGEIEEIMKC